MTPSSMIETRVLFAAALGTISAVLISLAGAHYYSNFNTNQPNNDPQAQARRKRLPDLIILVRHGESEGNVTIREPSQIIWWSLLQKVLNKAGRQGDVSNPYSSSTKSPTKLPCRESTSAFLLTSEHCKQEWRFKRLWSIGSFSKIFNREFENRRLAIDKEKI